MALAERQTFADDITRERQLLRLRRQERGTLRAWIRAIRHAYLRDRLSDEDMPLARPVRGTVIVEYDVSVEEHEAGERLYWATWQVRRADRWRHIVLGLGDEKRLISYGPAAERDRAYREENR